MPLDIFEGFLGHGDGQYEGKRHEVGVDDSHLEDRHELGQRHHQEKEVLEVLELVKENHRQKREQGILGIAHQIRSLQAVSRSP